MKKLVAFALILSLGLITLGCTPTTKEKTKETKTTTTEKEKGGTPAKTTDTPPK